MARIFWDTNHYIYLFEGHPVFGPAVRALRERMLRRGDQLVTSMMTLAEVQVKAMRANQIAEAKHYKRLVAESSFVIPFDEAAAEAFVTLRTLTRIKGPDAIQLACASAVGVDFFVTNDTDIHKLRLPGISQIASASQILP